ncbi:hypothetical protein OUZ56_020043 [Daphnia magna]|uniref:Uncharacterized protein n=1 Tax=Daphnia magna TaxID=35525 RepID=A0ABQ9ZDD6_9CRUS|nr:hypothetical protein OUZ56_020043 [Daphnia magna]
MVSRQLGRVSQTTTQPLEVGYVGRHPRDTLSSFQAIARQLDHDWHLYPKNDSSKRFFMSSWKLCYDIVPNRSSVVERRHDVPPIARNHMTLNSFSGSKQSSTYVKEPKH